LIARRKFLDARAAAEEIGAAVDRDARRPVGRRVERNGDFDPPRFADDGHALMRRELRRAGERQMPAAGKLDQRARQSIDAEGGVDVERGDDARRLGGKDVARGRDRVTADVVEPAAARRPVADVVRVGQRIGKERLDRARRPGSRPNARSRASAAIAGESAP